MMTSTVVHTSTLLPRDRIIIALDVDDKREALGIVDELKGLVGMFKIGHQLFTAHGPDIVSKVRERDCRVFLDLKYHDIPHTVAKASAEAVKLGVSVFNVHALGGFDMMKAAIESVHGECARTGMQLPLVLAVTILTSMDGTALRRDLKITRSLRREVVHLAELARRAGMSGVVASPREISLLRRAIKSPFVVLTPGIRPAWAGTDDQKRVMTPADAVSSGADYIVIGRPVLRADSRCGAVEEIVREIREISEQRMAGKASGKGNKGL